jgi:hypothetical protein
MIHRLKVGTEKYFGPKLEIEMNCLTKDAKLRHILKRSVLPKY